MRFKSFYFLLNYALQWVVFSQKKAFILRGPIFRVQNKLSFKAATFRKLKTFGKLFHNEKIICYSLLFQFLGDKR